MGSAIGGSIIWSAYLPEICCWSTIRHGILPNRSDLRDQILLRSTGSLFWKVLRPFQLTWSNVSMIHNSELHCNLILADIILWTSRGWSAIVWISQGSNSASTSVLWKYGTHSYPQWIIKIGTNLLSDVSHSSYLIWEGAGAISIKSRASRSLGCLTQ